MGLYVWVLYINFTETIRHIQHNIVKHTHAGRDSRFCTADCALGDVLLVLTCCLVVVRGFKVRGSKRWFSPNGIANGAGNGLSIPSMLGVALHRLGMP